jgi:hypothetical protein
MTGMSGGGESNNISKQTDRRLYLPGDRFNVQEHPVHKDSNMVSQDPTATSRREVCVGPKALSGMMTAPLIMGKKRDNRERSTSVLSRFLGHGSSEGTGPAQY